MLFVGIDTGKYGATFAINEARRVVLVRDQPLYGCPACAEEARERQARRDLIMLAQDELFDDGARPARVEGPLERVSVAA